MGVYLTTHFNFKLQDSKWTVDKFPILCAGMSETIPIMVELTQYEMNQGKWTMENFLKPETIGL